MYAGSHKNCELFFGSEKLGSGVVVYNDGDNNEQDLRDIDTEAHTESEAENAEVDSPGIESEGLGVGKEAESCRTVDDSAEEASEHNSAYCEE